MPHPTPAAVSLEQLAALNDEIAALVRAGVPLDLGLQNVAGRGGLAMINQTLAARLQEGKSLPEALAAESDRIPPVYRAVVEAGARAGHLPVALEAISNYARELIDLRRQVGEAMVYPLIVLALAYGLFLVFVVHMIELLRETYAQMRVPMHVGLRALVWVTDHAALWWWIPPVVVIALVAWWVRGSRPRELNVRGSIRPLHLVPGLRRISHYFQYANFADLLAMLVEQRVPLSEGLRLAASASGDARLQQAAARLVTEIDRGDPVAVGRNRDPGFPPFLFWVLGQASRGLAPVRMLRHAARFYRSRAVSQTKWFKLMFPVVAALVVGGGITVMYALTVFGPLAELWSDLTLE